MTSALTHYIYDSNGSTIFLSNILYLFHSTPLSHHYPHLPRIWPLLACSSQLPFSPTRKPLICAITFFALSNPPLGHEPTRTFAIIFTFFPFLKDALRLAYQTFTCITTSPYTSEPSLCISSHRTSSPNLIHTEPCQVIMDAVHSFVSRLSRTAHILALSFSHLIFTSSLAYPSLSPSSFHPQPSTLLVNPTLSCRRHIQPHTCLPPFPIQLIIPLHPVSFLIHLRLPTSSETRSYQLLYTSSTDSHLTTAIFAILVFLSCPHILDTLGRFRVDSRSDYYTAHSLSLTLQPPTYSALPITRFLC